MKQTISSALLLGNILICGTVVAEDLASERASTRRTSVIEEIVVTAQKREERLQDVPIALSAFTGESLTDQGIFDSKDLTTITPGLQYGSLAGFAIIYLRGVGTDTFSPVADSSVATYIDGIYFPFTHGLAQSLGRLERVEVLKGPQGTLFGRNSTGGAINVVTGDPGDELIADAMLEVGNFDTRRLHAFVGGPLTSTVSASLGVVRESAESYYELGETSLIDDLIDLNVEGERVKLRWQPTDDLDFILGYVNIEQESTDTSLFVQRDPSAVGAAAGVTATEGNWVANLNVDPFNKVKVDVKSFHATWDMDWATLKSISAYQETRTDAQLDFEGAPANVVEFRSPQQISDVLTHELQLLSNDTGWLADKLTWIAGLYFIEGEAGFAPINLQAANIDRQLANTPGLGDILSTIEALTGAALPPLGPIVRIVGTVDTKSYAVFGQASYDISDKLSLTLGGRYQEEERTIIEASSALIIQANGFSPETEVPLFDFERASKKWKNFSPKVTLDYRFDESLMVYTTWSKGFKSGTFNAIAIYQQPDLVDPEEITSYEFGFKSDLLDSRLRFNGAIFQNTIENLQVFTVSLTSGGAANLENAAEAQIRGAEFDIQWLPLPSWLINVGGSWLDSEYLSFPDGQGWHPQTGLFSEGLDFTGNETVRAPETTANLGITYSLDFSNSELQFAGELYYNSGYFFDAQNTIPEEEYHLINLRASYEYLPWRLKATLFGKNIENEYSTYTRYRNDFGLMDAEAPPRTYGLRLQWSFD